MKSFKDYDLNPDLLDQLNKLGFTEPTPIQDKAIPYALSGKGILGSAGTGTGKTGAFGIPLISHMLEDQKHQALVLLPTRELALQVSRALKDFIGNKNHITSTLIIGGEDMKKQMIQLKKNPRIIVGTPGRINDHLSRGSIDLSGINYFVLDEVDRMLDMGFEVQLDKIAQHVPSERQTLMFSATISENIKKLSRKYLDNPIIVSAESTNKVASNIKQEDVSLNSAEKYPHLLGELSNRTGSVIVFIKSKYSADSMAKKLRKDGHEAESFHGDLRQNKRNKVLSRFRNQDYRILIATDIAARGLDIPHVQHVINYDLPQCPEDYIHRIGRTARAGASGHALNYLSQNDSKKWDAIQRLINPGATLSKPKRKKSLNNNPLKNSSGFKSKKHKNKGKKLPNNSNNRFRFKNKGKKPQRKAS